MGGGKSLCDKEVSEIKYHKDLFILQQGEGEERASKIVWGAFCMEVLHWEISGPEKLKKTKVEENKLHAYIYIIYIYMIVNSKNK